MNAALLFLHLIGLMAGAAGGFSSAILMRKALSMPAEEAKVVRGIGPLLANVSGIGLALMWATGLILVWSRWDGLGSLPDLFWVKAIFIATLTIASIAIKMTYAEMKKGNMAVASRLPMLGPAAGLSAILAVLFAVLTFGGQ